MKKILFLSILALSLSTAWGQSRVVQIEQLSTTYGAAPTVTFRVYWNTAPVGAKHLDSVWVFVDYQRISAGNVFDSWAAATLITPVASVSAGTPSYPFQPAARGFYLRGNAAGAFSATVTVALQNLADAKFNWCAYATDYPPNATLGTAHYDLHGTPPFVVNGSTLTPGVRTFSGECITALTDATGCPGLIPTPPATPVLSAAPDSICTGDTTTLTATAADAAFYSFDDGATWIATNAATFSPTTTTEYTIYIKNAAGCTATGAPATVTVVPPPVPVFINPPATYCADSTFDLTASAGAGSSYCFTQTYTGASHNPYLSGNDTDAGVDCDFPTVEYCSPSGDSTFSVRMPESGSVTICLRAWNAFGCYADTCVTIGATPQPAFALITPQGTNAQTISLNQSLNAIRYTATDATAVTVDGLPAGLGYTWSTPTVEITGTADVSATIGANTYTVTAVGHCGTTTTQGVITIAGELFKMTAINSVSFSATFTGTMYIDWGDGTSTYTTITSDTKTHTYTDGAPTHTVIAQALTITRLETIYNYTNLTALDVTKCPSLIYLRCINNRLSSLDLTKNTALTFLQSDSNLLSSLDVSKNTALKSLSCYNNQLSTLDVTKNTALTLLDCARNKLLALDVTKNTKLGTLYCNSNQLTELDLTKNTVLTTLHCNSNQLTSLDVSSNTALIQLICYGNQLETLNVGTNTVMNQLLCHENLLTTLDVSSNTALKDFRCYENLLTTLDVRSNTELTSLSCGNNQLDILDVRYNTKLTSLSCDYNQLSTLDVSSNTKLTTLNCGNNQLVALDATTNTALTNFHVQHNLFDAAALNALFGTLHSNTGTKYVYIRDNPGAANCDKTIATGKGWTVNTTN